MSRVEWSRLAAADVEAVVSYMLCLEFPDANRIKPSQGDGGIDVRVPVDGGLIVYQVKSFTGNITAARKRQIKNSWQTLLAFAEKESLQLAGWHLTIPEDPTNEQMKWFDEMTSEAEFPCHWKGASFVEDLAAKYPEVIDYYLHDGKDRVLEIVREMLVALGASNPVDPPAASQSTLEDIHKALNQVDPHFRYDFAVGSAGADGKCPPPSLPPNCVSSIQTQKAGQCVTYYIIARCREALIERPVPGSLTLVAETGTELQGKIEDWFKFGAPIANVPAENVHLDFPGGFGASAESGLVTIGPAQPRPGTASELTLRTRNADGTVDAELDFGVEENAAAPGGRGFWASGHDLAVKVIRYERRIHLDEKGSKADLSLEALGGQSPADLIPVARFLISARPPRLLETAVRRGPVLSAATAISGGILEERWAKLLLKICEDLATIQEHVIEQVLLPDLAQCTETDVESWDQAAILLRGEEITGTWDGTEIRLKPGAVVPPGIQTAMFAGQLSVQIGGKTYQPGTTIMQVATLRVDETRPRTGDAAGDRVWVVPGDDNTAVMRLVSTKTQ